MLDLEQAVPCGPRGTVKITDYNLIAEVINGVYKYVVRWNKNNVRY